MDNQDQIQKDKHVDTSLLAEADMLLNGPRAEAYGDVRENFKNIATIANILNKNRGVYLDVVAVANVLIALKIAREGQSHKRDNLVDAVAYINIKNVLLDGK